MKSEVLPVWKYFKNENVSYFSKIEMIKNLSTNKEKYNELAKEIFKKYLP
jgi:hypothetical protein